jgi:hypothetical protein
MPAKSAKQERFMQAVANNPEFAKQAGVPQSVGKEFTKSKGGQMKTEMKKVATKAVKGHEARMHKGVKKMAMGGMAAAPGAAMADPRTAAAAAASGMGGQPMYAKGGGVEKKGKTKGKMVKMAKGGMASKRADGIAKKGKTSCKMG